MKHLLTCCAAQHRRFDAPWPVNWSTVAPSGGKEVAVVGDDPVGYIVDGDNSEIIAELQGHLDFSFAAAWHPDGNMLATGNQVRGLLIEGCY